MRSLVLGAVGILSILGLGGRPAGPVGSTSSEEAVQTAAKGGVAMLQDNDFVYIYDASLRKVIVISKHLSEESGKPTSYVIAVDKIKD